MGEILYALSAFVKVLLYSLPFAPKLQEDLSLEKKPKSCRLHSADYDTSISKGACQKALPAAITETSGRSAMLSGNTCFK